MSDGLLPCPFCGEKADVEFDELGDTNRHTVMCSGCYATGPEMESYEGAVIAWSARADRAQAYREGQERGFERAKKAIADIPYGRTEEVCEGHEDAYRAIEKLEPEDLDQ